MLNKFSYCKNKLKMYYKVIYTKNKINILKNKIK